MRSRHEARRTELQYNNTTQLVEKPIRERKEHSFPRQTNNEHTSKQWKTREKTLPENQFLVIIMNHSFASSITVKPANQIVY